MTKRAVFYIASQDDDRRFIREATCSADSVRQVLGLPTILFVEGGRGKEQGQFTEVRALPPREEDLWYLDATRYFNIAVNELADYDQLLYLDVDTHICWPCMDLFDLLERYDMALGQSPQRDAIESVTGTPDCFTTLQIGVNVFRNDDKMRAFFADWLVRYEANAYDYDNNDQASLRDALWENTHGIRWMALPPEYCLRFDFGCWVVGKVRILHGRIGGVSVDRRPLKGICDSINSTHLMRIWLHGKLLGQEDE